MAISDGGTGAGTVLAAFNNLSPLTTRGDIIVRDATNNVRKAIGTSGYALLSDGTDPQWTGFLQGGSAFTRTWQEKGRDEVASTDYGVELGGADTADYTTELQAWLNYCYANGKVARLKGFPRHSGLTITGTGAKFALVGDPGLSGFVYIPTTGDDVTLDTTTHGFNNLNIRDVYFDSVSTEDIWPRHRADRHKNHRVAVGLRRLVLTDQDLQWHRADVRGERVHQPRVVLHVGLNGRGIDLTGSALGTVNGLSINELKVINGLGGGTTTAVHLDEYVFAIRIDKADIQGGGEATKIDHGVVIADTSSDGSTCNDISITNSHIDTLNKELVKIAGGGVIKLSHNVLQFSGFGFDGITIADGHTIFVGPANVIQGNSDAVFARSPGPASRSLTTSSVKTAVRVPVLTVLSSSKTAFTSSMFSTTASHFADHISWHARHRHSDYRDGSR